MLRTHQIIAGAALVLLFAVGSQQTACFFVADFNDCSRYPAPNCFDAGVDDGGTDGGDGGEGGPPPSCAGDPTQDPAIVNNNCGVFVSAGAAPGGTGSQEQPFATFAEAAAASPSRVFACAGSYTETAQVGFSGGVAIYGGFTACSATSWTWSASMQASITTVTGKPGVVLDGGTNTLENVNVTAPSAPMTMAGGSSIALVVNGGSLTMTNGALTAGDAQDGTAGVGGNAANLDGAAGPSGANACDNGLHDPGPMGATNTCVTGGSSTAGNGGPGGQIVSNVLQPAGGGVDGGASPPASPMGANDGKAGVGEGESGALSCTNGDNGAPGAAGTSGAGAAGPGAITASGYQGASGTDGTNGSPGQGGGGGGGAEGGLSVSCAADAGTISVPGASGGAGGTGGCGGALGGGGGAGGSSIALLVLDATVTLTNVTLTAGKGANGGAGGNGQAGGHNGSGGSAGSGGPVDNACSGGAGGKGGNGGPGGGGQGGHSLGIAFQGTTAPTGGTFTITMTNAGSGGPGGTNNTTANMGQGANGVAGNCWDFGKNAACM